MKKIIGRLPSIGSGSLYMIFLLLGFGTPILKLTNIDYQCVIELSQKSDEVRKQASCLVTPLVCTFCLRQEDRRHSGVAPKKASFFLGHSPRLHYLCTIYLRLQLNMTSRRNFIKRLGMAGLSLFVPAIGSRAGNQIGKSSATYPVKEDDSVWDVIVVGGGPAGCTAAIAAAREGARTLLIEAMGQLGGMGTIGLVPTWSPFSDGERIIYRGLAMTIFEEARKGVPHVKASQVNWVPINAEYLMRVYDRLVTASGSKVLFFSRLCAVEKRGNGVEAVVVANKDGLTRFKAKVFVDATGDGDLAAWAGASFKRGYDAQGTNQLSTLCFSIDNVDMYDFNAKSHLDTNGDHASPLWKAAQSGKYPLVDAYANVVLTGPGQLQFNAGHIALDTTDPWQVSEAMITGRKKAAQYLQALQDLRPSTFGAASLVKTASVLGVRDSRRIMGDYVLTGNDWRERRSFADEIGRNCYYIDIHGSDKPAQRYKKGESHGIPYRCLTPKGLRNVLTAGRCISADSEVFGSTRIMPCCMVTGEAAGEAAALAAKSREANVHKVDTLQLRELLRQHGQYLP